MEWWPNKKERLSLEGSFGGMENWNKLTSYKREMVEMLVNQAIVNPITHKIVYTQISISY